MKKSHATFVFAALLVIAVPTFAQNESDASARPRKAGAENPSQDEVRPERHEYRLLATNKTSTMERELNEAAAAGFRFKTVMGGDTTFGGSEAVVVMSRVAAGSPRVEYKLLATNKTSTMQRELQQASSLGYEYRGQTVYKSTFGGREVVLILERDITRLDDAFEYKLLATSKTSTMQKELNQAGAEGYSILGMTVGKTAFGGNEVVAILRRPAIQRSQRNAGAN
jgi:hypothetical protein